MSFSRLNPEDITISTDSIVISSGLSLEKLINYVVCLVKIIGIVILLPLSLPDIVNIVDIEV